MRAHNASSRPYWQTSPVVSVARMQRIDRVAIETYGIPRLLLMEHAGLAVARAACGLLRGEPKPTITICCGSGFNGGDGLAAARHLHDWGYTVCVILTAAVDRLREEPAIFARILQRLQVPIRIMMAGKQKSARAWISQSDLVIDALLGIGASGAVREPMASLIRIMNASGRRILAVDVPSGLDADTGAVQGCAVHAAMTVTFGLPKRGCVELAGRRYAGRLITDTITIPRQVLEEVR